MNQTSASYLHLLRLATFHLECGRYAKAQGSLRQCVSLARAELERCLVTDQGLQAYCKALILLAATELRLQAPDLAQAQFRGAAEFLNQLHRHACDSTAQTLIHRYQCVLIRAQQSACTLSRLHTAMRGSEYEAVKPSQLHH